VDNGEAGEGPDGLTWKVRSQHLLECVQKAASDVAKKDAQLQELRVRTKRLGSDLAEAQAIIREQQEYIAELEKQISYSAGEEAVVAAANEQIIFDMGTTATHDLSPQISDPQVALNMAGRASGLTQCQCAALFLLQYNVGGQAVLQRARHTAEGPQPQTALGADTGIAAQCVATNAVANIPSLRAAPGYSEVVDGDIDGPALYLPLHVPDIEQTETWGCLAVYRQQGEQFDEVDVAELRAYASSCCVTLAGRRLQRNVREILTTAVELLSTPDFEADGSDVVAQVEQLAARIFRAEVASLHRVEETEGGETELVHKDRNGKLVRCLASTGLVGSCQGEGMLEVVENPRFSDSRFDEEADGLGSPKLDGETPRGRSLRIRNVMNCPIWHMEATHGVMAVCQVINKGTTDNDHFTEADRTLAELFCAQMGFVLEQKRLVRRLAVVMAAGLDIHRDCFVVGNMERFMVTCLQCMDSTTGSFFIFDEALYKLLVKTLEDVSSEGQLIRLLHSCTEHAIVEEQVSALVRAGDTTVSMHTKDRADKDFKDALESQGLKDCCCTVLRDRSSGLVVGALQVGNKLHGAYVREDEQVLEALAAQAEVCFENYAEQHQTVSRAEDLDSILKSLSRSSLVLSMDEDNVLASTNCVDDVTFIGDLKEYVESHSVKFDDFLLEHNERLYYDYLTVAESAQPLHGMNYEFTTLDGAICLPRYLVHLHPHIALTSCCQQARRKM
jgi:GAF domain-containing protein